MMDFDIMKQYRLPISESLKAMRIQKCPLDCGDGIFVDDQLELDNFIKIYEYTGGTVYVPNTDKMKDYQNNVVPIAGIMVSIIEKEEIVQVDKIFCEFGHEDFIAKLMQQILNFADFYNMKVSIIDLRRDVAVKKIRQCRIVDVLSW